MEAASSAPGGVRSRGITRKPIRAARTIAACRGPSASQRSTSSELRNDANTSPPYSGPRPRCASTSRPSLPNSGPICYNIRRRNSPPRQRPLANILTASPAVTSAPPLLRRQTRSNCAGAIPRETSARDLPTSPGGTTICDPISLALGTAASVSGKRTHVTACCRPPSTA
jgi:hypothetical protein